MRIAVCDDNAQDIERIKRYTIRMIEYAVDYDFFTKPEELVATYMKAEQKPDMYILDIEMPGMDGLAVAKKIRTYDSKALIVFLTSYTKYMPDEQSFAAIHGSFIVNLKHIKTFSGTQVILTDGTVLTVSRSYKKSLTEKHIAFVKGGM